MKKALLILIALLCMGAQGAWAQVYRYVSTESELKEAVSEDGGHVWLENDIEITSPITFRSVGPLGNIIDLNGHTLKSKANNCNIITLSEASYSYIEIKNGTISGGWAENGGAIWSEGEVHLDNVDIVNCKGVNGGAIHVAKTGNLSINGGSITGCTSVAGGAAIVNHGSCSISKCTISGNTATTRGAIWSDGESLKIGDLTIKDNESKVQGGAIYVDGGLVELNNTIISNNTSADGGGIVVNSGTLNIGGNSTVTGNTSSEHGGGGIVNYGTVALSGNVSITDNRCKTDGGGIWNNGTLKMKDNIKVSGNTTTSGTTTNVFLKEGKFITWTGRFTGDTRISLQIEDHGEGNITSGYSTYHEGTDPKTYFECELTGQVLEMSGGEVRMRTIEGEITYIERSWNEATKTVVSTLRTTNDYDLLSGSKDDYERLKSGSIYVVKGNVERTGIVVPNGTVHLILCDGAKFTGEVNFYSGGVIHIYGGELGSGQLIADGSEKDNRAGIGGTTGIFEGYSENFKSGGIVYIHGGTITATGGDYAAGIGGSGNASGGTLTVYGGNVTTTGGKNGAGIGVGYKSTAGGNLHVYGGNVVAYGGAYGAGIGGGQESGGINITVDGGHVDAYGGTDAAGIGTGEDGKGGGSLTVNGGFVFADGTDWGAGIGGGEDSKGIDVTINGGTVVAWAGEDAGEKNGSAIGSENGDGDRGSLHIGDKMMVHAGQDPGDAAVHLFSYGERVPACFFRPYCKVEVCNHEGHTYTINGTGANDTHTLRCTHCLDRTEEKHTFDGGVCSVCGAAGSTFDVKVYLPNTSGSGYGSPQIFNIAADKEFMLPSPPDENEPTGLAFAGWAKSETEEPPTLTDDYKPLAVETLLAAGEKITITSTTYLVARYNNVSISLNNDQDNSLVLLNNDKKKASSVTLTGRTLYKDGTWNTLCLPFDVKITESPLAGDGVVARTLDSSSFASGTLSINFTDAPATITAGTPFLIKWTSGTDIKNPEFKNVTINNNLQDKKTAYITFIGTFSPDGIYEEGAKTKLYLGSNNKLRYPKTEGYKVNSCRGYFQLKGAHLSNNITTEELASAHEFIINFGEDETTGISEVNANTARPASKEAWYTPDGRRLDRRPATKGIYINNGRKIVIP